MSKLHLSMVASGTSQDRMTFIDHCNLILWPTHTPLIIPPVYRMKDKLNSYGFKIFCKSCSNPFCFSKTVQLSLLKHALIIHLHFFSSRIPFPPFWPIQSLLIP